LLQPVIETEAVRQDVAEPPRPLRRGAKSLTSFWVLYRGANSETGLAPSGQLGASQIGARTRISLFGLVPAVTLGGNLRVSAPLSLARGHEAALGVSLRREGRISGELLVERRFGLNRGGRNALAVIAAVGTGEVALVEDIMLAGYAQAGLVGLRARDRFVDGAIRIDREIARIAGTGVAFGINARGAAQPGASRFDIGPGLSAPLRLGDATARLSVEWRHRIAGQARPTTGPAITIGADF
jgi:hypothetical protein